MYIKQLLCDYLSTTLVYLYNVHCKMYPRYVDLDDLEYILQLPSFILGGYLGTTDRSNRNGDITGPMGGCALEDR